MNNFILTLIYRFILGGTILSGATYLANFSNPLLAGILVTIPLELVSLFFIKNNRIKSYASSILIMSIATVIPVLYFNLVHHLNLMSRTLEIITSFGVWVVVSVALFYCLPKKFYNYASSTITI